MCEAPRILSWSTAPPPKPESVRNSAWSPPPSPPSYLAPPPGPGPSPKGITLVLTPPPHPGWLRLRKDPSSSYPSLTLPTTRHLIYLHLDLGPPPPPSLHLGFTPGMTLSTLTQVSQTRPRFNWGLLPLFSPTILTKTEPNLFQTFSHPSPPHTGSTLFSRYNVDSKANISKPVSLQQLACCLGTQRG